MIGVTLITLGTLKEGYWRDAAAEYEKRLSAFCRLKLVQLKEEKLSEAPTEGEIRQALEREATRIMAEIPPRAYRIAMCVEGKKLSSPALAELVAQRSMSGVSKICFVVGSSNGLHQRVKQRADFRLSMSDMTFPHHLARVMLAEQIYRAFTINAGRKYHK